jgi:hypothetical protein
MRERVRTARVARLATTEPDGRPHLVPIVFVLAGERLYSAVDAKPKRSRSLRRVANARERPIKMGWRQRSRPHRLAAQARSRDHSIAAPARR